MQQNVLNESGAVLVIVLIFLFVLTLLVTSSVEDLILQIKIQKAMKNDACVFNRAEAGLRQKELALVGIKIRLPASKITLKTSSKLLQTDACGNKTEQVMSDASFLGDEVVLRSRDIFAKVPVKKHCQHIPSFHRIWWQENG